ncbi:unnamed protein product [Thelazia callipaeda]|uniref:G protein-coupled receptor n=1 Tax=Thelazia callipaeda TaxID=103827 RepID=A0A0N5CXP1_THECL|nr:unnamed protein product [Thelazia callipaeda]
MQESVLALFELFTGVHSYGLHRFVVNLSSMLGTPESIWDIHPVVTGQLVCMLSHRPYAWFISVSSSIIQNISLLSLKNQLTITIVFVHRYCSFFLWLQLSTDYTSKQQMEHCSNFFKFRIPKHPLKKTVFLRTRMNEFVFLVLSMTFIPSIAIVVIMIIQFVRAHRTGKGVRSLFLPDLRWVPEIDADRQEALYDERAARVII